MTRPIYPLPASAASIRRRQIAKCGRRTLDMMFPFARCRACAEVRVLGAAVNSSHGYRSIKQLVDMAKKIAAASSKWSDPFPRCDCSGQLDPVAARYHAFHGGLGRDIVVLWRAKASFFGRASVELLIWGEDERDAPLAGLSDDDAAELADNAVLRDACVPFQLGNAAEGLRRVEVLSESHRGDPLLLEFLPPMLEAGFWQTGATIAASHRSAHPADPEGHFWFGQVLYTAHLHGVSSPDTVHDALEAFARTAALDPDHPGAHFNLGAMILDAQPGEALAHFEAAERLVPEDPDHPVGCARALLALGRSGEARAALDRARRLTPTHPRFAELDAALCSRGDGFATNLSRSH